MCWPEFFKVQSHVPWLCSPETARLADFSQIFFLTCYWVIVHPYIPSRVLGVACVIDKINENKLNERTRVKMKRDKNVKMRTRWKCKNHELSWKGNKKIEKKKKCNWKVGLYTDTSRAITVANGCKWTSKRWQTVLTQGIEPLDEWAQLSKNHLICHYMRRKLTVWNDEPVSLLLDN